jgi:hypothetical protein
MGTNTLNISNTLAIVAAGSIGATAILNCISGNIQGGGTLTNSGQINLSGVSNKTLGGTTLDNDGTLTIPIMKSEIILRIP